MQTEPQTQQPHLPLSYDALLSCKSLFQVLLPLITFRLSSPHHLIKARVLCTLFQPSSHQAVQDQEGHFIHRMLSHRLRVLPTDNPILPFLKLSASAKPPSFPGRFSLTLSSKICRSKMHNDISDCSAKVAVSAHNLHYNKGVCREELSCQSVLPS